jgi:hypothetical protein
MNREITNTVLQVIKAFELENEIELLAEKI